MSLEANLFAILGNTVTVDATSTTSTTAITQHPNDGGGALWVANQGPNTVHIKLGLSGVVATIATCMPILSGQARPFSVGKATTHVACICDTSETAKVFFTPGRGL